MPTRAQTEVNNQAGESDNNEDSIEDEGVEEKEGNEHCQNNSVEEEKTDDNNGRDSESEEESEENVLSINVKNAGRKVLRTPCGHYFHENCLEIWLDTNESCPMCRDWIYTGTAEQLLHDDGYE